MVETNAAESNAVPPPLAGLSLLVVDDHADSADSLAILLKLWGHRPLVAYDFATALKTAEIEPLDAVILDLALPGKSGCEIAGDLRKLDGWKRTPLVALTGFGDRSHRTQAREAGFDFFLVKPVEPDSLRTLLDKLLRTARLSGRMVQLADRHSTAATETATLADDAREFARKLQEAASIEG
ncbi:MAG TPA: response regulator [Gemmataceae bacterium]|jgi:DNA-binding response OmpR family regulator|nr:response regulator [Gemmataceae bacterium]